MRKLLTIWEDLRSKRIFFGASKHMYDKRQEIIELLWTIVRRRRPDLLNVVENLGKVRPTEEERQALMTVVGDELADTAFLRTNWSRHRRQLLEEVIDYLGRLEK